MLEDERFALLVTQGLEGAVDLLAYLGPLGSLLGQIPRRTYRRARLQRHLSPRTSLQLVLAEIDGDPEQPAADPLGIAAAIEAPIPLDERLLNHIGRVIGSSRHSLRVAIERVLVPTHQQSVRIRIAPQNIPDDIGVARLITGNPALRSDPRDVCFSANKTTPVRLRSLVAARANRLVRVTVQTPLSLAERPYRHYLRAMIHRHAPSVEELPTPSLLLDLDALENNLDFMQRRADSLGVRLRPHVKTHKCVEIARLQLDRGAVGITVSTLEEVRIFARAGIRDITWAFPVNLSRLDEVEELADETELGVLVDSAEAVRALEARGLRLRVWMKVDCGYHRAGVDPTSDAALELAGLIAGSATLEFAGCLTHAGHTYTRQTPASIAEVAEEERRVMVEFAARLRGKGIEPGLLSVGSTPGMSLVTSLEGIDEARPGNYALYDYTQHLLGSCGLERLAASVLASVVSSHPERNQCVADAGALVMSKDIGREVPSHFGRVYETLDGRRLDATLRISSVSQEHAVMSRDLPVGTRLRVAPNHSCLTVARFDHFTVIRGRRVVGRWRIHRERGPRALDPASRKPV